MKKAALLMRPRSFFGANIVNIPAIYIVKKYTGAERIAVFSDRNLAGFYQQIPWVDQHSEAQSFRKIFLELDPDIDFLYSMRPSMDSLPFLKLGRRVKKAIGLSLRSKWLNSFYDYHLSCDTQAYRGVAHIQPLMNYLQLPQEAGFYMREAMLALLGSSFAYGAATHICLMPGAGAGEHKKWGIENYWSLAQQLHALNPIWQFDFILGVSEQYEKAFLLKRRHHLPFKLHQNLSLRELIKIVENSSLTIANDCGPSHISQCLAKPFIGIYGQPNPEWFFAHEQSHSVTARNTDIKSITVATVYERCLNLLEQCPRKFKLVGLPHERHAAL